MCRRAHSLITLHATYGVSAPSLSRVSKTKRRPLISERRSELSRNHDHPLVNATGSISTSVPNPDTKAAAVIAIVVVVDSQYQSAIYRNRGAQLAADQIWLAQLAVRHANIGDQGARSCRGHWTRTDHGTKTGVTPAFGTHFADSPAGNHSAGRADRDRIANPHIDAGVGAA